jgi:general secretion pathway protein C
VTSFPAPPEDDISSAEQFRAPPPSDGSLVLHGVLPGGSTGPRALISSGGGPQRAVRVGLEIVPGVTLATVAYDHIIVEAPGGDMRVDLLKAEGSAVASAALPQTAGGPQREARKFPPPSRPNKDRAESLQYRLGFEPHKRDGRISGFRIRPGVAMPVLQRAGLQPGDILLGVNGQPFDTSEKVLELSGEIAGSYTAEFEFERNGRKMKKSLEINRRPE